MATYYPGHLYNIEEYFCNKISLTAEVCSDVRHFLNFKRVLIKTKRRSGEFDAFPLLLPNFKFGDLEIKEGMCVSIEGKIVTFNVYEGDKRKLDICVMCNDVDKFQLLEKNQDIEITKNKVYVSGEICKVRKKYITPLTGREVCEVKLVLKDEKSNKKSFLPVIGWGENAKILSMANVGDIVAAYGRLQSRKYEKKYEDGTSEEKVAIELSTKEIMLK